jgi:intraflagellar transport protein 56
VPDFLDLLSKRDYVGAITVLKFKQHSSKNDSKISEWLAYAHFHYGEHDKVC